MIFSKCPRCDSERIRRGYRRAPIWWRLFGRYHLLCNACNWEFVGWAIPGTVDATATRRRKKRAAEKQRQASEPLAESKEFVETPEEAETKVAETNLEISDEAETNLETSENDSENRNRIKVKKRVRLKLNK